MGGETCEEADEKTERVFCFTSVVDSTVSSSRLRTASVTMVSYGKKRLLITCRDKKYRHQLDPHFKQRPFVIVWLEHIKDGDLRAAGNEKELAVPSLKCHLSCSNSATISVKVCVYTDDSFLSAPCHLKSLQVV